MSSLFMCQSRGLKKRFLCPEYASSRFLPTVHDIIISFNYISPNIQKQILETKHATLQILTISSLKYILVHC